MGARSSGREAALQILFAVDASAAPIDEVIRDHWREHPGAADGREYGDALARQVLADIERLDRTIAAASEHWKIERMNRVDRNTLRIGTWELLEQSDIPGPVILDEAVALAKRFGTTDSGAFVNGVLARVARDAGRADDEVGAEQAD